MHHGEYIAEYHICSIFLCKKIERPSSSSMFHLLDEFYSHTREWQTINDRPV